jgi:hypothetical protein
MVTTEEIVYAIWDKFNVHNGNLYEWKLLS